MAVLPGVTITVLDGNLNLQAGNSTQNTLWLGCSLAGTPNTLGSYSNASTMAGQLIGGRLLEAASYDLSVAGGVVYVMPMTPSVRGGISTATHIGPGAGTLTLSLAPHASISYTCVTGGTLGTAAFVFTLTLPSGQVITGSPVTSAGSWSSTGYRVPGTYVTIVFTAGTYVAGGTPDIYTISTLGVVAHPQGTGPAVPTFTASPVDDYSPRVAITTAGALGTMQFTYCLDYNASAQLGITSANTSSAIVSPGGGVYAIPNTGIVLTFAGTFVAGDTYDFSTAAPTFGGSDLTAALTALQTTYLPQMGQISLIMSDCANGSASAWATQVASLETAATALFNLGVYVDFFASSPTVGTVLPNAGSVTVDASDTDSVVIAQRALMSAADVCPCAGDALIVSPSTGLNFRRPGLWAAAARAASVEPSQDIGAVEDGGLVGVLGLFRDENATPAFFAAGITCLRTFTNNGNITGFFVTQGLMATIPTSDYYTLTNSRVIDEACTIVMSMALIYTLAKIPTTTRNGQAGVITERKAQKIETRLKGGLDTAMVDTDPQNAVATRVTVDRTHNILSDSTVPINVAVQPFAYGKFINVRIGMTVQA
jgi:hypothetical protein